MNKVTIAVIIAFFTFPVLIPNANAINANYRAQLERSGCTEMNAGITCDIHKTKAQNQKQAQSSAGKERAKLNAFLEESVLEKSTDDAYEALGDYGFTNPEPLKWVKGHYLLTLQINDKGEVFYVSVNDKYNAR